MSSARGERVWSMSFLRGRLTRRCLASCFVMVATGWICYMMLVSRGVDYGEPIVDIEYAIARQKVRNDSATVVESPEASVDSSVDLRKIKLLRRLAVNRNVRAEEKLKSLPASKHFRYIIMVQIHDRVTYIRALLDSLAATSNITDALVVLSHDVIDEQIDNLAWEAETNFEVVQIYFPHSIQLYPNEFPGTSALDCPERVGKVEAAKRKCINHDHPDSYGNYRTPRVTQVKHHWWWKFQFVFTRVPWAQANIPVIFLEEDHYVFPDALAVLDQLLQHRDTACTPRCPVLSIGHHKTKLTDEKNAYRKYFIDKWVGARDNIGIIFDYEHYKRIDGCAFTFCESDDYNWDWTLHFVTTECLKKEYQMIVPLAPRVLHIGDCGGIHHKKSCNPQEGVRKAVELVGSYKAKLFPESMEKSTQSLSKLKNPKRNGGWGDPRDHELCRNITLSFPEEL